ncbi:MAG TPA: DUF4912 domain-containing protein [Anaeromyxobacteraceae bacterium]|nr:DUF4912 domain-containing protein [Anaeromyxobacteraceae bacterium]
MAAHRSTVLEKVVRLLGASGAAPGGLEALRRRTRDELLEAARELGLTRVSKLRKDELARRVLDAVRARAREPAREPPHAEAKPARAPARKGSAPAQTEPAPAQGGDPERDPTPLAKLDLGPAPRSEPPVEHIPWSYGLDRITAAAVDPDRLYAYWEVTDPSIERARVALGPGGAGAWLNLRVYDASGIIFDGTNAHGYFDHAVDRSTRQWFFAIQKPTSTAFVEVGMKSSEGYFVKIARSGRVDFPRREPAPWGDPEWMTVVTATGEARVAGRGAPVRPSPPAPAGPGEPPVPFAPIPLWVMREVGQEHGFHVRELRDGFWKLVEWSEVGGDGWYQVEGRVEWEGPAVMSTWQAGPFTHPVEVEPPRREEWKGGSFAYRVGDVTHVVYGPWQVVIHNLGAGSGRAVVSQWQVYRSWVTQAGREVRLAGDRAAAPGGGSERLVGASERLWAAGSELRLGGASERWRIGASELRLRGASELLFRGASERRLAGASERRLLGASERRLAGASERMLQGASERGGASEQRLGGASEQRLGAGDGRSEADAAVLPYPSLDGGPPGSAE